MKARFPSWAAFVVMAMAVCAPQEGAAVVVDPDDFAIDTNISESVAGITLSVVNALGTHLSDIFSVDPTVPPGLGVASTGSLTFGHTVGDKVQTFNHAGKLFRVDFASLVTSVSLDFIANDDAESGRIRAFDSAGDEIDSFTTSPLGDNQFATGTVSGAGIAFILAGGAVDGDTVLLDNLDFTSSTAVEPRNAVAEPTTLALMAFGVLSVGLSRRRVSKA